MVYEHPTLNPINTMKINIPYSKEYINCFKKYAEINECTKKIFIECFPIKINITLIIFIFEKYCCHKNTTTTVAIQNTTL